MPLYISSRSTLIVKGGSLWWLARDRITLSGFYYYYLLFVCYTVSSSSSFPSFLGSSLVRDVDDGGCPCRVHAVAS